MARVEIAGIAWKSYQSRTAEAHGVPNSVLSKQHTILEDLVTTHPLYFDNTAQYYLGVGNDTEVLGKGDYFTGRAELAEIVRTIILPGDIFIPRDSSSPSIFTAIVHRKKVKRLSALANALQFDRIMNAHERAKSEGVDLVGYGRLMIGALELESDEYILHLQDLLSSIASIAKADDDLRITIEQ